MMADKSAIASFLQATVSSTQAQISHSIVNVVCLLLPYLRPSWSGKNGQFPASRQKPILEEFWASKRHLTKIYCMTAMRAKADLRRCNLLFAFCQNLNNHFYCKMDYPLNIS
jgi:hypothetical protein